MALIEKTIRLGQKPTKEELKRIRKEGREAAKHPITYDKEFPESKPEALAEFAAMARELRKNKRNIKPVIAIRVMPEALAKYKALGKGYTGIMADVLNYVADNPEILSKASAAR
jgi:uncharacterized protein (DUF4415 family)